MGCVGAWTFMPLGGGQGGFTLLDAADAGWAQRWSWRQIRGYAARSKYMGGGKAKPTVRTIYLAREILGLGYGDERNTDHINRDPLDNRRCNLRTATFAENCQNRERAGGESAHRGVVRVGGRWRARAAIGGRFVNIGYFGSEDEAAEAARKWRAEHMPFAEEAAA